MFRSPVFYKCKLSSTIIHAYWTNGGSKTVVDINSLESRIDALIKSVEELSDENRALRIQQDNLIAERASLIEKSERARSRVESMIARLKAMELG